MPGVIPPERISSVYTQRQVYALIFPYYVDKADMLMNLPGMPDFVGIKSYLNRSLGYAIDEKQRQMAITRLNAVDRIILLYKADVAAGKGRLAGLTAAKKYLNAAAELDPDEIQANLYARALSFREEHTTSIDEQKNFYDFFTPQNKEKPEIHGGFVRSHWCGSNACESRIKEDLSVTIRCIPLADESDKGACICCGQASGQRVVFAKAY